jgi:ISXO2-like transposase domain
LAAGEVSSEALCAFVGNTVTAGATVRTDGWNVYGPLAATFGHESIVVSRSGQPAHVV